LCLFGLISGLRILKSPDESRIENKYILKFRNYATEESIAKYFQYAVFSNITADTFQIGKSFRGAFVELTPSQLMEHIAFDDVLEYIEENRIVSLSQACSVQTSPPWGLDRICERDLDTSTDEYHYPGSAGNGVYSYIIDTGIRTDHTQFGGRAIWGADFIGDGRTTDCNGHGTHCAGTVGSALYGVAKRVFLVAVRVLNCSGSGTLDGVIRGIQWAVNDAVSKGRRASGNMSLGSSYSASVNNAVRAAIAEGLCIAVAAGNSNADACNYSPASEESAISVGATTIGPNDNDAPASFSNWGECVHVYAPGQNILSTWHTSTTAVNTISGTSMAAPHVAGVIALRQAANGGSCADIKNWIIDNASEGHLAFSCGNSQSCLRTPNLILHNGCTK
jgi:subtilisin family serine protease